ncbi:MAG: isoleucine--tRNA ligase [Bdellovibrionales bacterium]|nr:isoleucine--tRNA ligase [Bdellovibrionales bacterium]
MKPVDLDVSFPELEEQTLSYWREQEVFQRSIDPRLPAKVGAPQNEPRPSYVFYDGPPFATGLPHYGHLLAGTIKDVIGRFFTMKGYHVDRRFGWDCHGVPVEFEIQKTLGLHGAKAIREYGVGRFNEECRKIVLRYTKEWEKFVERSGRWVDFDRQYRTMDLNYMESIWWVVKQLWDKGLIFEGLKSVPYSWAINTPLSNFEANLNYKTVQDPAVTVRAKLLGKPQQKLALSGYDDYAVNAYVWTTTPWTLPSNMAIAVGADIDYVLVANEADHEIAVLAEDLAEQLFPVLGEEKVDDAEGVADVRIVGTCKGSKLVGLEYEPFFSYFENQRDNNAFRIYGGSFVTAVEGTGLVHCASFGEEDVALFQEVGIPVIDPVDEDGNFTEMVPDFAGQNIKAADPNIIQHLKDNGKLVSHKTIEHSYPFCWRTDTPLMYKPVSSWFVKVESMRDELLHINSIINWVPGHIKDGRFGKWLEGARDWAISRNRFWGTPLPIWRCDETGEIRCIGSVTELEELTGEKVEDLHSHFIDNLTFPTADGKGVMKRVPEVLDCWFESGAMPYAQAHYPFENKHQFEQDFPADFIAEGLDQTRGWFYTLLVLSTALFGRPAFKNVIVNGIVLAEDGKKMSKSLKNYPPPDEVMNEFGADAMRLYLLASAATRGEDLRFSKAGVKNVVRQTILPLWNAYNFFVTYALVDGWTPSDVPQEKSDNLLDRWILSKTASLIEGVDTALSSYRLYAAIQPVLDFVDQLTNWYIRLNRRRFWSGDTELERADKLHAYATLHRVLRTFVRVLAPLAPFVTEEIFRNLKDGADELKSVASVHHMPFPSIDELGGAKVDQNLEKAMELFEEVIVLGRSLRNEHNIRVRQPLAKLTVVYADDEMLEGLKLLDEYIKEELNVKHVEYTSREENFVTLKAQLNTKRLGKVLGPKLGSDGMKALRSKVESFSTREIREIESGEPFKFQNVTLSGDDILIMRNADPAFKAAGSSGRVTIVLDTGITRELRLEGLAREFVNRVQKLRKDSGLEVQDRIILSYMTACPQLTLALEEHRDYISRETLAVELTEVRSGEVMAPEGSSTMLPSAQEIGDKTIIISISRLQS